MYPLLVASAAILDEQACIRVFDEKGLADWRRKLKLLADTNQNKATAFSKENSTSTNFYESSR
jgi:hypothetical protein